MACFGVLLTLYLAAPHWVPPAWSRQEARSVFLTSRGFLAQVLAYFLRQNTDYIVIGGLLSTAQVGFYYTAYRLAEVPVMAIVDPVSRVTFAGFSEMRARGDDIRSAYLNVLQLVAVVACPLGVVISATADPFTHAILGSKWAPMIPTLSVLGLWAAIRPVAGTAGWLLNSSGYSTVLAKIDLVLYPPFVVGVVLAAAWIGIVGVAWVVVGFTLVGIGAIARACRSYVQVGIADQVRMVAPVLIACPPAWVSGFLVTRAFDGEPLAELVASVLACVGGYVLTLSALDFELVKRSLTNIARTLGR